MAAIREVREETGLIVHVADLMAAHHVTWIRAVWG
jgi:8-oxo-dGTP pyrophosphatase MutT (NUDIX family)